MHLLAGMRWDILFEEPAVYPFLSITGLVLIVLIVAPQFRRAYQTRVEARLKERMLERGFSADEIERVVWARSDDGAAATRCR